MTQKRKVIIRADGSAALGWGHVYRSLALAMMLKDNFDCLFVSHTAPGFLTEELTKQNISFSKISEVTYLSPETRTAGNEVPFDMDALITGNEIVVLDGYWFGTVFQQAIKAKGCRLVYIDDLHDILIYADLIINPAIGITPAVYNAMPYTQFAIGPGFSLLRPSFLAAAAQPVDAAPNNIFICFGGSDPLALTKKTLQVLQSFSFFKNIHCVTGPSFNSSSLREIIEADSRVVYHHCIDERKMAAVMCSCGCGIVPASSVLVEAIACNIKCITCYYAQNQRHFHDAVTKTGIPSAGWVDENFEKRLQSQLSVLVTGGTAQHSLRQSIAASKKNIIDMFKKLAA